MMGEFEGKVVAITGAGSGIGRQTALDFAAQGASLVIIDIAGENATRVAEVTCPASEVKQTKKLLPVQRAKGTRRQISTKFSQWTTEGNSLGGYSKISHGSLRALETAQKKGPMKINPSTTTDT